MGSLVLSTGGYLALLASLSGCSGPPSDEAPRAGESSAELGALDDSSKATPHPIAPGGYYVSGAHIFDAKGRPHLFHGVARPSFEWSPDGQNVSAADFREVARWRANVVRIALNQDFWLAGASQHAPRYPARLDEAIRWAEEAGLDVILDLHWSDRGDSAPAARSRTWPIRTR